MLGTPDSGLVVDPYLGVEDAVNPFVKCLAGLLSCRLTDVQGAKRLILGIDVP